MGDINVLEELSKNLRIQFPDMYKKLLNDDYNDISEVASEKAVCVAWGFGKAFELVNGNFHPYILINIQCGRVDRLFFYGTETEQV